MKVYGCLVYHSHHKDIRDLNLKNLYHGYEIIHGLIKKNYDGQEIDITPREFKDMITREIKSLQEMIGYRKCIYYFFLYLGDGTQDYIES